GPRVRFHGLLLSGPPGGIRAHAAGIHPARRRADRSVHHRKVRMSQTTHRHFHDDLSALKVALLNMSGDAQAALAAAVDAVLQRDGDKAKTVIAGDRDIDRLELEVEEAVI